MSRFSKAEAEALGWAFAHSSDAEEIITSETQGETRVRPASVRAEKVLAGGGMINEEAENIGLLLERIFAYEEHLKSKAIEQVAVPVNTAAVPLSEEGLPIRHVILADGTAITEEDLASRSRQDAILTKDGMEFHGKRDIVAEAEEARDALSAEKENERAAEPDVGPTVKVDVDDSQTVVDLPGGRTGSSIILREGESLEDVQERRDAEANEAESSKSLRAPLPESEAAAEAAIEEGRAEEADADEGELADTLPPEGEVFTESSTEATKPVEPEDGGEPE